MIGSSAPGKIMLDEHIEPLTGLPLRGLGRVSGIYQPLHEGAPKVIFFNQVFGSVSCQACIYELSRAFIRESGASLLLCDGAEGAIEKDCQWPVERSSAVPEAVLRLVNELHPELEVHGVDDWDLMDRHWQALALCQKAERSWRKLADRFAEAVREAQVATGFSADLSWLAGRLCAREGFGLQFETVLRLLSTGSRQGLTTKGFPALEQLASAFDLEQTLDFSMAEAEREQFIQTLVGASSGWVRRRSEGAELDLTSAAPALGYWQQSLALSDEALEERVARCGLPVVLGECERWLLRQVLDLALRSREQTIAMQELYEGLLTFGLLLGVDTARYSHLRTYIDYVSRATALRSQEVLDQLDAYVGLLAGRLIQGKDQRLVLELARQVRQLARAGLRQLTPREARVDSDLTWTELKRRLSRFSRRASMIRLHRSGPATKAAHRFQQISARRGRHMADTSVELLRGHSLTLAVFGGFHSEAMTDRLRHEEVAWSTIVPEIEKEHLEILQ